MILVVDDHADTCRAVSLLLALQGMDARCVTSGEDALAALRTDQPHCVLLDDHMPGLTGLDVLRTIRTEMDLPELPVIIYSAAQENERVAEAKSLGADWIVKGTPFDRVIRKIDEVCNH